MFWVTVLIFLLLAAGLSALFGVELRDLKPERRARKRPLTDTVREAQGLVGKGLWKEGGEVDRLLKTAGRPGQRKQVIRLSLLLFGVGAALPALLGNPYLSPVLGAGLSFLPLCFLRQRESAYRKNLNVELETAVSIVTTSYLRSEDLVQSVRENLSYIGPSVKEAFSEFVYGTQMINANVPAALNVLKSKIPNAVFGEWCDAMIQCQSDRTLKHTLLPVLEKFSDVRVVQSRLETLLSQPRREAVTMMLLVAANIPLLYVLNRSWFNTLLYTTPGQIALAVCAGIVLFAAVRVLKLSKPIEYSR